MKVPDEIRKFNHLVIVDLQFNQIRLVESGTFKFPDKVEEPFNRIDLGYNQIARFEAGAFQGKKN